MVTSSTSATVRRSCRRLTRRSRRRSAGWARCRRSRPGPWTARWSPGTATRWRGPTSTPSSPRPPPGAGPLPRRQRPRRERLRQTGQRPLSAASRPLRVVYTALHGVAASLALQAIEEAGFPAPFVVAAQEHPDPDFPTVAFPNPEEPGTLDLALAQARAADADLILANDPDGDRLAVAVPDPAGPDGWRVLTGDQVGALIGSYLLERTATEPEAGQRLVVTTVVSSTLLGKIAAAARGPLCRDADRVQVDRPRRAGDSRPPLPVRVRGGARVRGGRRGAGQGRHQRGARPAVAGRHRPRVRPVTARPLGRPGGRARRPPDSTGHPARPVPGRHHGPAAGRSPGRRWPASR